MDHWLNAYTLGKNRKGPSVSSLNWKTTPIALSIGVIFYIKLHPELGLHFRLSNRNGSRIKASSVTEVLGSAGRVWKLLETIWHLLYR